MTDVGPPHLATGLLVTALLVVTTRPSPGPRGSPSAAPLRPSATFDTIVDSFHGYEFGTPADRIGEIDISRPPDARMDGLEVYARSLRFIGMPTRAYFYLDSAEYRLRRGKHLIEPDASSCVRQLTTLRLMVAGTHPDLSVRVIRGSGAERNEATGRGAPPVQCPGFMDAEDALEWSVLFRNPDTDAVEVRMELFRREGQPRILACYLNTDDCDWPDSVTVEPGPKLLAPGRGPDTTDAPREERG